MRERPAAPRGRSCGRSSRRAARVRCPSSRSRCRAEGARRLRVQRGARARQALGRPPRELAARARRASPSGRTGRARGGRWPRLPEPLARGPRWRSLLASVLAAGARSARATRAGPARAGRVRLGQPDGTAQLGHGRQAVLGDCIARLLDATGHEVTREYYFNDGGRQMRVLGESLKARYLELLGRAAAPPAEALAQDPELPGPQARDGLPVVSRTTATRATTSARSPRTCVARHGDALVDEPAEACSASRRAADLRGDPQDARARSAIALRRLHQRERPLRRGRARGVLADLPRAGPRLRAGRRGLAARHGARARARPRAGEVHGRADLPAARHRLSPREVPRGFDRVIDVQGADHFEQFPFVRAAAARSAARWSASSS